MAVVLTAQSRQAIVIPHIFTASEMGAMTRASRGATKLRNSAAKYGP